MCIYINNDTFSLLSGAFRAVYGRETVIMMHLPHKNYLRTCRRKIGLTQPQLGHLIGRPKGYVSALETGKKLPTVSECVVFERLFERSFEEIWPVTAMAFSIEANTRIKTLHAHLAGVTPQSYRKQQRLVYLQRQLGSIMGEVHEA